MASRGAARVHLVVAVQADEGLIKIVRRPVDVQIEVRPWQLGDGADIVDWWSALRRWAAK